MRNHGLIYAWLFAILLCGCGNEPGTAGNASSPSPKPSPATQEEFSELPSDSAEEEKRLGEYVSFPACGIEIRQPDSFEKADSFDGFGHGETQSSVMAISMPGPYAEMVAGFTPEKLKARGWTFRGKRDLKVGDFTGVLVHFEQPTAGQVFGKWTLIFGDNSKTTMVTAAFPEARRAELSSRLKACVLSTRRSQDAPPDPGADAPITLTASPKLTLTPAMNRMLAYTKDGAIPIKSPGEPMFIAAASLGQAVTGDRREFAAKRLRQSAAIKDLSIESSEAITIDGLEGWESLSEAKHADSEASLVVYQVILFQEDSYFLLEGRAGSALRDEYLPEFKAMARSLKRKQP